MKWILKTINMEFRKRTESFLDRRLDFYPELLSLDFDLLDDVIEAAWSDARWDRQTQETLLRVLISVLSEVLEGSDLYLDHWVSLLGPLGSGDLRYHRPEGSSQVSIGNLWLRRFFFGKNLEDRR